MPDPTDDAPSALEAAQVSTVSIADALKISERRYRRLFETARDGILILDGDQGGITDANPFMSELLGYSHDELLGKELWEIGLREDKEASLSAFRQLKQEGYIRYEDLPLWNRNGGQRQVEFVSNIYRENGHSVIQCNIRDITDRRRVEAEMAYRAFHDPLTGLPNRSLFMETLSHALERSSRTQLRTGVIFIDLDNFKTVNDSLGHAVGDQLLKIVAERLRACTRPGDTVARIGGDEFTILIEDISDDQQIFGGAERFAQVLSAPIIIGAREIVTFASLGIACSKEYDQSAEDLIGSADIAMHQGKMSGKGRCVEFDPSMNARALERFELEYEMRRALENDEFRVFYQPIIDLESGKISEVEALVRWEHPSRGILTPNSFVPLAEETGIIVPLGQWVLATACRQMHLWHTRYANEPPLTVCVNLSIREIQQVDLVERIRLALREAELSSEFLKLEITESVIMKDSDMAISKLHELKALGVRLAVDDFGTGYSSMAYLSNLPLDTLKIDRSFVSKLGNNTEDEAIVGAIVTLAKTLKLKITSEGIETPEQLAELRNMGSEQGQGYLFGRPMSAKDLSQIIFQQTR